MTKKSIEPYIKKIDNTKLVKKKPNIKKIKNSLLTIHEELIRTKVYKEDASAFEEMQRLTLAINKVYTYLYNNKQSNLTKEDAVIFIDHLVAKLHNLKNIIEKL